MFKLIRTMKKDLKLLCFLTVAFICITYKLTSNLSIKTKSPKVLFEVFDPKGEGNHSNQSNHYGLHIIVLVYNRYRSLARLLESINFAEYYSDKIHLQVWIDRKEDGTVCQVTLQTARNFIFKAGDYEVKIHPHHVGLYGQWLTTWVPDPDSREIAVFFEDDVTVSKYFYKYIKLVHEKYDNISEINGYSLQGGMKRLSVGHRTKLHGPRDSLVFLYPSMGPWGFSPKNRNWRKFLDWFNSPDGYKKTKPYIPGNVATYMYKAYERYSKTHTMWTIWHRYYSWKNEEYTMFCNFPGNDGLAANWRERGLHFGNKGKKSNPLLSRWRHEYENLPTKIPRLDLTGNLMP